MPNLVEISSLRIISCVCLALAACGGTEEPGGGGGGGGGDAPDAGMMPMPETAPGCTGAVDFESQYSAFSGGTQTLVGTVTLPASLPSGRRVEIESYLYSSAQDSSATDVKSTVLSTGKSTVTYRYKGLPSDATNVTLVFRADVGGDNTQEDPGDYVGYYAGSVGSPILDENNATTVTMTSLCQTGVNFGLGVRQ